MNCTERTTIKISANAPKHKKGWRLFMHRLGRFFSKPRPAQRRLPLDTLPPCTARDFPLSSFKENKSSFHARWETEIREIERREP